MKSEWHDLIQQYISGTLPDPEARRLEATLKKEPAAADLYLSYINLDVTLEAHASSRESISQLLSGLPLATDLPPRRSVLWRPVMAAAAGLVLGLFSASLLFAYASPQAVVTASRLPALVDGDFEAQSERIRTGFPLDFGVWSGDEAGVVPGRKKGGGRSLCFKRAQGDAAAPQSPAESCDVFQLVDLRALRSKADGLEDAVLELSADFLDGRAEAGTSLRFGCHLYLFAGRPEALHSSWPAVLREAVGYGVGGYLSEGGGGTEDWRRVTARCFLPPNADFAVVQIACGRPRGETRQAPELGHQLADNVTLTLKTQPRLPIRLLHQ
jgi:hypothetical protein